MINSTWQFILSCLAFFACVFIPCSIAITLLREERAGLCALFALCMLVCVSFFFLVSGIVYLLSDVGKKN